METKNVIALIGLIAVGGYLLSQMKNKEEEDFEVTPEDMPTSFDMNDGALKDALLDGEDE